MTQIARESFITTMKAGHSDQMARFAMSGFNSIDPDTYNLCDNYYKCSNVNETLERLQKDMERGLFL